MRHIIYICSDSAAYQIQLSQLVGLLQPDNIIQIQPELLRLFDSTRPGTAWHRTARSLPLCIAVSRISKAN